VRENHQRKLELNSPHIEGSEGYPPIPEPSHLVLKGSNK